MVTMCHPRVHRAKTPPTRPFQCTERSGITWLPRFSMLAIDNNIEKPALPTEIGYKKRVATPTASPKLAKRLKTELKNAAKTT
uniref:60S ribosomal protein L13 n=1 Tax=Panagrellus redivivus TaxID=6233 RepID=A0A7E4VKQ9_PANRE